MWMMNAIDANAIQFMLNNTTCGTLRTNFYCNWIRHYLFYAMKMIWNVDIGQFGVEFTGKNKSIDYREIAARHGDERFMWMQMVNFRPELRYLLINTAPKCDTPPKMGQFICFSSVKKNILLNFSNSEILMTSVRWNAMLFVFHFPNSCKRHSYILTVMNARQRNEARKNNKRRQFA